MMRHTYLVLALVASMMSVASVARADDPLYTCKQTTGQISASFAPQTSLKDLVTWVVGFTCKNVVFDADVEARVPRVTIIAPKPMTAKQALQLFIDAVEATGLKVVQKKDTMIIKLGPDMPKTCVTSSSLGGTVTGAPIQSPPVDDAAVAELEKLMESGITKVDDTHIQVSRSLVDAVLSNPMAVAKGARVVPAIKDGKPNGFKLYAIRPSSIYARLGFTNGDTLKAVNGLELTSADKALEVYTKIREAKSLTVEIERRGKPITLVFTIKK